MGTVRTSPPRSTSNDSMIELDSLPAPAESAPSTSKAPEIKWRCEKCQNTAADTQESAYGGIHVHSCSSAGPNFAIRFYTR